MRRRDGQHVVTVLADLELGARSTEVTRRILDQFSEFSHRFPGYVLQAGGEAKETDESFQSLYRAFLVAVVAIFLILTIQFNSLAQPFLILLTVPLAAIGVILGLFVTRMPFGVTAMVGLIGLAGIAVNNALVLIDFINERRAQGLVLQEAVLEGCRLRMRPILLTAVTTVLGLLPTAMGWGGKSEIWSPMAASVACGLTASCLLMLLFLPVAYLVLEDLLTFRDGVLRRLRLLRED